VRIACVQWRFDRVARFDEWAERCADHVRIAAERGARFELLRHRVAQGAQLLFVRFCTDDRAGYLRVRYSCAARAIENQMCVALAGNAGILRNVQNLDINYAQSGILTPSDHGFARNGIAAEAAPGIETIIVADLDFALLRHARESGTVQNLDDRRTDLCESRWKAP
jgi:predicted amidohydrolase